MLRPQNDAIHLLLYHLTFAHAAYTPTPLAHAAHSLHAAARAPSAAAIASPSLRGLDGLPGPNWKLGLFRPIEEVEEAADDMIEKPEPSSWLRQGLQQLHLVSPREGDELIDTDEPSALLKLLYGIAVLFQLLPPAAALGFIAYATVNGCGELGLVGDEAQLALLGLADEMALPLSLSLYLALEALHYLWTSTCSLMEPAQRVESTTTEERLHTWRRCLADTTTSCEAMITGWFYRKDAGQADSAVRLEELTRGNVREWLAWALAIGKGEKLLEAEEAEVDVAMKMLEEALSRQQRRYPSAYPPRSVTRARVRTLPLPLTPSLSLPHPPSHLSPSLTPLGGRPFHFPDGHVATIASMRLNRDPPSCNVRPRPLFYYAITDLAINGLYTPHKMKAAGFKYYVAEGLSYWYHPGRPSGSGATSSSSSATAAGTSSDAAAGVQAMEDAPSVAEPSRVDPIHQHASASKPVVFVHGVGLGPLPYLGFIEQVKTPSDPDHPLSPHPPDHPAHPPSPLLLLLTLLPIAASRPSAALPTAPLGLPSLSSHSSSKAVARYSSSSCPSSRSVSLPLATAPRRIRSRRCRRSRRRWAGTTSRPPRLSATPSGLSISRGSPR